MLRYSNTTDQDTLLENPSDHYANRAKEIVKMISDVWSWNGAEGTPYSQQFIDPKRFLFLPHKELLVGAGLEDAVNGLEESIKTAIGEPVKVEKYIRWSQGEGATISVLHSGDHLPKVLLNGNQVPPIAPNPWPED